MPTGDLITPAFCNVNTISAVSNITTLAISYNGQMYNEFVMSFLTRRPKIRNVKPWLLLQIKRNFRGPYKLHVLSVYMQPVVHPGNREIKQIIVRPIWLTCTQPCIGPLPYAFIMTDNASDWRVFTSSSPVFFQITDICCQLFTPPRLSVSVFVCLSLLAGGLWWTDMRNRVYLVWCDNYLEWGVVCVLWRMN